MCLRTTENSEIWKSKSKGSSNQEGLFKMWDIIMYFDASSQNQISQTHMARRILY